MTDFEIMTQMSKENKDITMCSTVLEYKRVKNGGHVTIGVPPEAMNKLIEGAFGKPKYYVALYIVNIEQFKEIQNTPSVSAASPHWVKAFAQIAKICDNITASPNNQSAQDAIKKLATGEVSENALIEIKKLSYRIIESDNYDTGNMEILDIALVNLAFPN